MVSGRVQGVFYRASAHDVAQQLGLVGWVRNLPDSRVEAVACGSEQQLVKFEEWLHQGPAMAIVEKVETSQQSGMPDNNGFEIRYS